MKRSGGLLRTLPKNNVTSPLVQINITRPDGLDSDRASKLRKVWGLNEAIVLPDLPEDALQIALANAAASYLTEHLTENDVLGRVDGF